MLFKLYIEDNGATDEYYSDLDKEIKALLKDFNAAINYLDEMNYTKSEGGTMTIDGVRHFEDFIEYFL